MNPANKTNETKQLLMECAKKLFNEKGGILLFNPGTANGKKRSNGASYGILEIKGGEVVSAKIRGENEN